jgi:protein phosphatase
MRYIFPSASAKLRYILPSASAKLRYILPSASAKRGAPIPYNVAQPSISLTFGEQLTVIDKHAENGSVNGKPVPDATTYGASDIGRRRETNQDQYLVAQLNKSMLVSSTSLPLDTQSRLFGRIHGQVLLVADGMGGHAAGEKASSLAIDHLVGELLNSVHWFFLDQGDSEEQFVANLKKLLQDAHSRILFESERHDSQRGMGTTLTMAHLSWPRLYVVHAGDSRCYLIRNGETKQLTTDHTLARQLVESGGLKPEDEAGSRWSNVLWNVLGGRAGGQLIAEVHRADLEIGDTVVLCSDGLHRYVNDATLGAVVSRSESAEHACRRLIDLANDAGGEDNITVIVCQPHSGQITHSGPSENAEDIPTSEIEPVDQV